MAKPVPGLMIFFQQIGYLSLTLPEGLTIYHPKGIPFYPDELFDLIVEPSDIVQRHTNTKAAE